MCVFISYIFTIYIGYLSIYIIYTVYIGCVCGYISSIYTVYIGYVCVYPIYILSIYPICIAIPRVSNNNFFQKTNSCQLGLPWFMEKSKQKPNKTWTGSSAKKKSDENLSF